MYFYGFFQTIIRISARWVRQLMKTRGFSLIKNVLLQLFNLQYCLFFYHKMIKFKKAICSAWINCTSANIFFSYIDVICVAKIQWKYLRSIELYFHGHGFFKLKEVSVAFAAALSCNPNFLKPVITYVSNYRLARMVRGVMVVR